MVYRVTLIAGDGIGPEVVEAARRAIEATGVTVEWDRQEMGACAFARTAPAQSYWTDNLSRQHQSPAR